MNILRFPSKDVILNYLANHPQTGKNSGNYSYNENILETVANIYANQNKDLEEFECDISYTMLSLKEINNCPIAALLSIKMNLTRALLDCAQGKPIVIRKPRVVEITISDPSMIPINYWEDVKPFADRIIAYRTDTHYFGKEEGYPLSSDSTLKFAYVDAEITNFAEGIGYNMTRLLKPKDVPGTCGILDSSLEDGTLLMRLATKEEIQKIAEAIDTKKARFEYVFSKKEALSLLYKQDNQS